MPTAEEKAVQVLMVSHLVRSVMCTPESARTVNRLPGEVPGMHRDRNNGPEYGYKRLIL